MAYRYACSDYLGMAPFSGKVTAESKDKLWKHIELPALLTHEDDPSEWPDDERAIIEELIATA